MKIRIILFAVFALALILPVTAMAAPFKAENNPQIVANYPTGDHGIVGEPYLHEGADVVMKAGKSGNFQQWFYGTSAEPNHPVEGDHSVWKLSKDGTCKDGWDLVENANQSWGDYLQPGNYCVKTNDFKVSE